MFCYQCEQRVKGGCTIQGVCGKPGDVADLQDLINHISKVIGKLHYAKKDIIPEDHMSFLEDALFTTITNVDFDITRLSEFITKGQQIIDSLQLSLPSEEQFKVGATYEDWQNAAKKVGIMTYSAPNEDLRSLRSILLFGLKGLAAYAAHARILGRKDSAVSLFFVEGLASLLDDTKTLQEMVGLCLKCGEINIRCMEILNEGHIEHYGIPTPTEVPIGVKKGPAILISGHDMLDLEELLKQTADKGINIYTHGEMLPAHGYPGLNKYKHLAGNYGSAWQNQHQEFAAFPGTILMTTNCIQKPASVYLENIFTTGLVAWPGVTHLKNHDFAPLIKKALELGGFPEDKPEKSILVGFGHHAVLGVANKVIEAVKAGKIKHFFLIGGCDGAKPGRNYYTELAEKVPADCLILTLACGKYRFNKLDFGTVEGLPRLLDVGQCNDAYSAIKIASALAGAFNCSVNELPLSIILSWYEQKAVVVLLSLLSLGIKNIKLGPTLPEFVTPNVLQVLVENFNIGPTTMPDEDLKLALE